MVLVEFGKNWIDKIMKNLTLFAVFSVFIMSMGCSSGNDPVSEARKLGQQYLLTSEPSGAVGVITAREDAKDGDELVMVGRIGGAENPWIDGRAAFTLLDTSMSVVAEGEGNCESELCLGNCCPDALNACTVLVKVVDSNGKLVRVDSRELLGVLNSDMVVATGMAQRDENGNFVMLASGVYIHR